MSEQNKCQRDMQYIHLVIAFSLWYNASLVPLKVKGGLNIFFAVLCELMHLCSCFLLWPQMKTLNQVCPWKHTTQGTCSHLFPNFHQTRKINIFPILQSSANDISQSKVPQFFSSDRKLQIFSWISHWALHSHAQTPSPWISADHNVWD